jgi:hypothetical protein
VLVQVERPGASIGEVDVASAIVYLDEKGLLRVKNSQGYISGEPTSLLAEITGRGIDVFETPEQYPQALPKATIQYIIRGHANIVHGNQSGSVAFGDQQNVQGDNVGSMAQGAGTFDIAASFPTQALRERLGHEPPGIAAVAAVEAELSAPEPKASRLFAKLEALQAFSNIAVFGVPTSRSVAISRVRNMGLKLFGFNFALDGNGESKRWIALNYRSGATIMTYFLNTI